MMRDCTVFHSNYGPLGPFFRCRDLAVTQWAQLTRAELLALVRTPNLIEASMQRKSLPPPEEFKTAA